MKTKKHLIVLAVAWATGAGTALTAQAGPTQVEGAAGGGIVPWGMLSGGKPTTSLTWVNSGDFNLTTFAVNGTVGNRVELSYARQQFAINAPITRGVVQLLGHDANTIDVDVVGAKIKLMDAPALALGIQYKKTNLDQGVLDAIGAKDDSGTDVYLAATKVVSIGGKNMLLDGTLRATKANQIGILGFGGQDPDNEDKYTAQFEGTAGVFVSKASAFGVEYRMKPDNLKNFKEKDWWDIWWAYMPENNWSLVLAYANLGDIVQEVSAGVEGQDQRGLYLQVQANF